MLVDMVVRLGRLALVVLFAVLGAFAVFAQTDSAVLPAQFDIAPLADGGELLLVTTIVEDPVYLNAPYVVSPHFKK